MSTFYPKIAVLTVWLLTYSCLFVIVVVSLGYRIGQAHANFIFRNFSLKLKVCGPHLAHPSVTTQNILTPVCFGADIKKLE